MRSIKSRKGTDTWYQQLCLNRTHAIQSSKIKTIVRDHVKTHGYFPEGTKWWDGSRGDENFPGTVYLIVASSRNEIKGLNTFYKIGMSRAINASSRFSTLNYPFEAISAKILGEFNLPSHECFMAERSLRIYYDEYLVGDSESFNAVKREWYNFPKEKGYALELWFEEVRKTKVDRWSNLVKSFPLPSYVHNG